jgi:hypothetical protein
LSDWVGVVMGMFLLKTSRRSGRPSGSVRLFP